MTLNSLPGAYRQAAAIAGFDKQCFRMVSLTGHLVYGDDGVCAAKAVTPDGTNEHPGTSVARLMTTSGLRAR